MASDPNEGLSVRIAQLERKVKASRRMAIVAGGGAAIVTFGAFGISSPQTVDADRLVLHAVGGGSRSVELSVSREGALQAEFKGDDDSPRRLARRVEIVIVDQQGRETARLGGPVPRNIKP